jgi:hypothetical protein
MISSHAFPTGFARGNAATEFGTPPDHGVVFVDPVDEARRRNRLIERNAKCRYLKNFTCKGTLRQVFYLSEAPSHDPIPPPPHYTLYTCFSKLIHTERGGELTKREG